MAVTKSWETPAAALAPQAIAIPSERQREFRFLVAASAMVLCGLIMVYFAKTQSFGEFQSRVQARELLNLNTGHSPEELQTFLPVFSDSEERGLAAQKLSAFLEANKPLPNVGALSRLRITPEEARIGGRWTSIRQEFEQRPRSKQLSLIPIAKLKPSLVVRTPSEYRTQYIGWCSLYLVAFWVVHFAWRTRRFRGDPAILPSLLLLTGIGLMLAVSLRDPLRDSLEFRKFAWGAAAGCVMLLLPLLRAFQIRHFSQWIYTPLFVSLLLFGMLLIAGSGPTGSDAKVNLGPFQPVELIKILLVLFLAGYFARRWEWLRDLRQTQFVPAKLRWLNIPRLEHALPVLAGVTIALVLFFVLKDMGPALVIGLLVLLLFAIARGAFGLAATGIMLLVSGISLGYHFGTPHTVVDRIKMWLSPWDNNVRGGDQIAHSLWAFSTGGPWGSGPGMGDPGMIPAGHTDLVLASIGEEWGFVGILIVFGLFGLLVQRAFRIAVNAANEYATFLAFGLGSLIAIEMLLISAGVLDAIPLSGVVSPFLSSGNTAMISNFLVFAILLTISNQSAPDRKMAVPRFTRPIRIAGWVFVALSLGLVLRAAYFQISAPDQFLIHDTKVIAEDGVKRTQYNPRLTSLMRQIPRGDIYDRNSVLLATSNWEQLRSRSADFEKRGISLDKVCPQSESRCYPFGPALVQFLGDWRSGENFQASNTSLVEHDADVSLRGYTTLAELAPAVRYRHYKNDRRVRALRDRNRDVRTTIDVRLQMKIDEILDAHTQNGLTKAAAVVMDPATGDVLASVSVPHPVSAHAPTPGELLDRARYGEYPPGSTFKLVTAMAALNRDREASRQTYACSRLPDGRAGTMIRGWNRPIRDDIKDHPHGVLDMLRALSVSCNAYFAQLGVFRVGSEALRKTASQLEISTGNPAEFKAMLPFSSYGQGPVVTTPFKMARVVATVANRGQMPQGRWIIGQGNSRGKGLTEIVAPDSAEFLARAMRTAVTDGTGRTAMAGLDIAVAGKTGTAQVGQGEPHSWFAGFAPYGEVASPKIVVSVVVEHGGYGARAAAPIAREIIQATRDLDIIHPNTLVSRKR